jgi:signal transduction histidine kinase
MFSVFRMDILEAGAVQQSMADRTWRILLVEDDEDDYMLTREMLAEARGSKYHVQWASSYDAGKNKILSGEYDAILMDYELGAETGLDLTREVNLLGCKSPIILLTGRGNYDIDVEAMQVGVTDYLSKSEVSSSLLERAIRYAISQKQTEEELRSAKEELESRVQERTLELSQKNITLIREAQERLRIEAELAEVQRRLIDRTEDEQRELARELHDGPMQELYGLTFHLEVMQSDFAAGQGEESIADMREKLLQVIDSLRSISRELRPPALAPYGLEKALRSHIDRIRATNPNLTINISLDADQQELPESVRLALFRIYQTSITNVIRHSEATEVEVRFLLGSDTVILEVQDNGCGFNVPQRWIELARKGHLGLVGASERAEAAGGHMLVQSEPGKGTLIHVQVPRQLLGQQAQ